MADEMNFEGGNNRSREVDFSNLDEILNNSVSKVHASAVSKLKQDPKNFNGLQDLKLVEKNAHTLAAHYLLSVENGTILKDEAIGRIAATCLGNSYFFDIINRFQDHQLKEPRHVKNLVEAVEECIENAFQLAKLLKSVRDDTNIQKIINVTAQTEETTARLEQGLAKLQNDLAKVPKTADFELIKNTLNSIKQWTDATSTQNELNRVIDQLQQPQQRNDANILEPSWMVPKNECLEILPKNFARSYLLKLLTNYEIFMSPKGIPKSKRIEFKRIWKYFYPDRTDGKAQMKKWSLKLRDQKRRLVYKEIQTTHTFGITDSGNEFYFEKLRPEICYTRISCCAENVLPANPVGNCGIYVPQKHFIFKSILLIEKLAPQRHGVFKKMSPNGRITKVKKR